MNSLVAVVLAGSLLAGCSQAGSSASAAAADAGSSPVPVSIAPLRYATIATPIELSGSLAALDSVTVGAPTGGRIVAIDVRVGDVVHASDVLARIDAAGPAAELDRARAAALAAAASERASRSSAEAAIASVASAHAQLDGARSRQTLVATTAQRMEHLFAQGAISEQQVDQARADLAAANAAGAQAQAALDGARHSLAAAQDRAQAEAQSARGAQDAVTAAGVPLRDATVRAPFGGTIVDKLVEPGAVVGTGSPIVTLQNTHDLEVDVAVPDDARAGLTPGVPLSVRVDAIGSAEIPARVRAIVPSQNPALHSVTLKIALPSRPELEPGMYAHVSIPGAAHTGWLAPLDALVTRAGQRGVFVVRDGTASFVPLQTGTVGQSAVEVLGIDGRATHVAVSGLQRIDDGSRVTVTH